jgi:hypothetical protein
MMYAKMTDLCRHETEIFRDTEKVMKQFIVLMSMIALGLFLYACIAGPSDSLLSGLRLMWAHQLDSSSYAGVLLPNTSKPIDLLTNSAGPSALFITSAKPSTLLQDGLILANSPS